MKKIWDIANKRFRANTLIELLLTMIISGIVFLLVFDGVEIVKKYSFSVNKRLTNSQNLLYSHQFLEYLMENADSIIQHENNLLFFQRGEVSDSIRIEQSLFLLKSNETKDTLFHNYLNYTILFALDMKNHVDSLFISSPINIKDTIRLEYGVSLNYNTNSKNYGDNED